MSSKKAKAARRNQSSPSEKFPNFGLPLGFKIQGKETYAALGLLDLASTDETFVLNSEEGEFTPLNEKPVLYGTVESIRELLSAPRKDKALGVYIIRDKQKLVQTPEGVVLENETLPFAVGGKRLWRNPKLGSLLTEEDDELEALQEEREYYSQLFPGFGAVYKVEQIVTVAPISASHHKLFDTRLGGILKVS